MIYKNLAHTNIKLSAIGIGTGDFHLYKVNDDVLIKALKVGVDSGINFIDTAENYMGGNAENIVGDAIRGIRKNVFIATKVSPKNLRQDDVIKSAENSLKKLKTDYIDLYQIHWPNPEINLEDTLCVMNKLKQCGKIRFIGVSNFLIDEYKYANHILDNEIVSNQIEYNLCNRTAEKDILPYSVTSNKTVIAYSPFKNYVDFNKLKDIADKYNVTIFNIILNWLIVKQNLVVLTRSINYQHIYDNVSSTKFSISAKDLKNINKLYENNIKEICVKDIEISDKLIDNLEAQVKVLSQYIKHGVKIKPIKVKYENGKYKLLEGKFRFLSWKFAFGENALIDALIY